MLGIHTPSTKDYVFWSLTEDDFIRQFRDNNIGACFEYYTTGAVVIETNFWDLSPEFLDHLNKIKHMSLILLFKHSKLYKNTWTKHNNSGTYPAISGLKTSEQVVKLINTQSIRFIMED